MIFKETKLNITDTSGLLKGKVFHVYSKKKCINSYGFVYTSIRETLKKKQHLVGKKKKMFVIHTKKKKKNLDHSTISYLINGMVPLKKRLTIVGYYTKGPINYNIKKKKLLASFNAII